MTMTTRILIQKMVMLVVETMSPQRRGPTVIMAMSLLQLSLKKTRPRSVLLNPWKTANILVRKSGHLSILLLSQSFGNVMMGFLVLLDNNHTCGASKSQPPVPPERPGPGPSLPPVERPSVSPSYFQTVCVLLCLQCSFLSLLCNKLYIQYYIL